MEPEYFDPIKDAVSYLVLAGVTGYLSQKIGYMRGHRAKEKELEDKYLRLDQKYDVYVNLIDKKSRQPTIYNSIKYLYELIDKYF